ncbi:MAG TPA: hypothetical protein VFM58_03440 [Solirubrobacteraceae bacterium]|jgi:hypothetical protein|nr:hypothetical protein [Solirubrobacteraceae bacterium]
MSATSGHNLVVARSHAIARQRKLRRILESYGVLTHDALQALARGRSWRVPFETVLERAVASGRVVRLPGGFYEAGRRRDDDESTPR